MKSNLLADFNRRPRSEKSGVFVLTANMEKQCYKIFYRCSRLFLIYRKFVLCTKQPAMQQIRPEDLIIIDIETASVSPSFEKLPTEWKTLWQEKVQQTYPKG